MIIKNQDNWSVSIDLDGEFLSVDEILLVSIEETTDLSLPVAHLVFRTQNYKKVKKFTEADAVIKLGVGDGYGEDIRTVKPYKVINKTVTQEAGGMDWSVDIWLIYDAMDYYDKHRMEVYNTRVEHQLSSDVFKVIMERYGLSPVVKDTKDKMMWVQSNISDRKFIEDVLSHGFVEDDIPLLWGIRRDGVAKYLPIKDLLVIKGDIGGKKEDDFPFTDYILKSNDGFLSSWLGETRHNIWHNSEDGIDGDTIVKIKPQITEQTGFHVNEKFAELEYDNDNVHAKWLRAKSQNIQNRANLSSKTMEMISGITYRDIYVLDCYKAIWENQEKELLETFMGLWLVTRVKHQIADGYYTCSVTFARETLL